MLGRELVSCMYLDEDFGEDVYVGEDVVLKMVVLGVKRWVFRFFEVLWIWGIIFMFLG